MNKILEKQKINYTLLQLAAFTFVCIISLVDVCIDNNLIILKLSLQSFTVITIIVYEIIIHIGTFRAPKNVTGNRPENGYAEQFLWFNMLSLFDVLILVYILYYFLKRYDINIAIYLIAGFAVFYFISMLARPYFGVTLKK